MNVKTEIWTNGSRVSISISWLHFDPYDVLLVRFHFDTPRQRTIRASEMNGAADQATDDCWGSRRYRANNYHVVQ